MFPAKNIDLIADPILHIILVYFLEAGTNCGLLCVNFLYIGSKHLLKFIIFKKTKHPFLLVGVQQNTLTIELIIIEFANVRVAIGKSSFPEVPESTAPVEPTLHALEL